MSEYKRKRANSSLRYITAGLLSATLVSSLSVVPHTTVLAAETSTDSTTTEDTTYSSIKKTTQSDSLISVEGSLELMDASNTVITPSQAEKYILEGKTVKYQWNIDLTTKAMVVGTNGNTGVHFLYNARLKHNLPQNANKKLQMKYTGGSYYTFYDTNTEARLASNAFFSGTVYSKTQDATWDTTWSGATYSIGTGTSSYTWKNSEMPTVEVKNYTERTEDYIKFTSEVANISNNISSSPQIDKSFKINPALPVSPMGSHIYANRYDEYQQVIHAEFSGNISDSTTLISVLKPEFTFINEELASANANTSYISFERNISFTGGIEFSFDGLTEAQKAAFEASPKKTDPDFIIKMKNLALKQAQLSNLVDKINDQTTEESGYALARMLGDDESVQELVTAIDNARIKASEYQTDAETNSGIASIDNASDNIEDIYSSLEKAYNAFDASAEWVKKVYDSIIDAEDIPDALKAEAKKVVVTTAAEAIQAIKDIRSLKTVYLEAIAEYEQEVDPVKYSFSSLINRKSFDAQKTALKSIIDYPLRGEATGNNAVPPAGLPAVSEKIQDQISSYKAARDALDGAIEEITEAYLSESQKKAYVEQSRAIASSSLGVDSRRQQYLSSVATITGLAREQQALKNALQEYDAIKDSKYWTLLVYGGTSGGTEFEEVYQSAKQVLDGIETSTSIDSAQKTSVEVARQNFENAKQKFYKNNDWVVTQYNSYINSIFASGSQGALATYYKGLAPDSSSINDASIETLIATLDKAKETAQKFVLLNDQLSDYSTIIKEEKYQYADAEKQTALDNAYKAIQAALNQANTGTITQADIDNISNLLSNYSSARDALNGDDNRQQKIEALRSLVNEYANEKSTKRYENSTQTAKTNFDQALRNAQKFLDNPYGITDIDSLINDLQDAVSKLDGDPLFDEKQEALRYIQSLNFAPKVESSYANSINSAATIADLQKIRSDADQFNAALKRLDAELANIDEVRKTIDYTEATASYKASLDNLVADIQEEKADDLSRAARVDFLIQNLKEKQMSLNGQRNYDSALSLLNMELNQYSNTVYSHIYQNDTAANRKAYRDKYDEVRAFYNSIQEKNVVSSVVEINAKRKELEEARTSLAGETDLAVAKRRLQTAILINSIVDDNLNAKQKATFERAVASAKNDGDLRQLEETVISIAKEQEILKDAINDQESVEKSARYEYADALQKQAYQKALQEGRTLLVEKSDVDTDQDVTEAQRKLKEAINSLGGKSPTAQELQDVIDDSYSILTTLKYTGSGSEDKLDYMRSVSRGRFVLANPESTDQDYQSSIEQINSNKSKLNGDLPQKIVFWGFGLSAVTVLIGYFIALFMRNQDEQ